MLSLLFGFAAVALVALAIFWPGLGDLGLNLRLAVALLAVWCGGIRCMLSPEVRVGFGEGLREFRKGILEGIYHDDDDDGPHPA